MEYHATSDANDNLTRVETTALRDGKREPYQRYVLKYSNNNPVSIEVYDYDYDGSITNQAYYKASQTYDARGNLTLSESYKSEWISESESKWIGLNRQVSTYDANGNRLSFEEYIWDTSTGSWVGSYKYVSTYDANGNESSYESYWNTSSGSWTGSSKTTCEKRNAYGDVILSYSYSWKDGGWEWTTYTVYYPGGTEPSATEHIGDAEPLVYAHGGMLHIRTVRAERTDIYTLDGARVYGRQVPAGTTTLPLPPGMYIVKVGNRTEKIAIGK
jgi:hypothetical protein